MKMRLQPKIRSVLFAAALAVAGGCGGAESEDAGRGDGSSAPDSGGPDGGDANLFWPDAQTPFMEKGLILPPNSIPCVDVDGGTTYNCNHHGSTVAELSDGTIAAVWYHGLGEKSHDSKIIWSRLHPGAKEWTWPETLYDDPERAEGNPAIWVHENGEIFVFFVTIFGRDRWDDSYIRMVRSRDNGGTWTAPVNLREEFCWMTRYRPQRLDNGGLLLPLYDECLANPMFIRSMDDFTTWEEMKYDMGEYFVDHVGQIQPSLIRRSDGSLMAITRNGLESRRIGRQVTKNNAKTWTKTELTELPNSGTSVEQVKLLDGHVVVAFNNSPYERFPLNAALSLDEGQTFTAALRTLNSECDGGSCSYAYPSINQSAKDGTIWVTYTHNRETIGWIHFNEAWLMQGHEPINTGGN